MQVWWVTWNSVECILSPKTGGLSVATVFSPYASRKISYTSWVMTLRINKQGNLFMWVVEMTLFIQEGYHCWKQFEKEIGNFTSRANRSLTESLQFSRLHMIGKPHCIVRRRKVVCLWPLYLLTIPAFQKTERAPAWFKEHYLHR